MINRAIAVEEQTGDSLAGAESPVVFDVFRDRIDQERMKQAPCGNERIEQGNSLVAMAIEQVSRRCP